jgi:hypothetical protein
MSAMLTVLPLAMIGGGAFWVSRRISRQDAQDAAAARSGPARPTPPAGN